MDVRLATKEITTHSFDYGQIRHTLVDTPGFDDSSRSDKEILQDVINWLSAKRGENVLVSAFVYMHRISDTRIQGSSAAHFRLLRKLCGEDAYNRVSFCTSFWDIHASDQSVNNERFQELQSERFWGEMIEKGARIYKAPTEPGQALRFFHNLAKGRREISEEDFQHHSEQPSLQQLKVEREKYEKMLEDEKLKLEREMSKKQAEEAKRIDAMRQAFEEKLGIQNRVREKAEAELERLNRRLSDQSQMKSNLSKEADKLHLRRANTDINDKFQQAVRSRKRRLDSLSNNMAAAVRILETGKKNRYVKCDIAPDKDYYRAMCSNCLQNIGTRSCYG
jgi:hypothetical protein